jgi:hypothetical protein
MSGALDLLLWPTYLVQSEAAQRLEPDDGFAADARVSPGKE